MVELIVDGERHVAIGAGHEVDERGRLLRRLVVRGGIAAAVVVPTANLKLGVVTLARVQLFYFAYTYNLHHLHAGLYVVAMRVVHQVGQPDERVVQRLSWRRSSLLRAMR